MLALVLAFELALALVLIELMVLLALLELVKVSGASKAKSATFVLVGVCFVVGDVFEEMVIFTIPLPTSVGLAIVLFVEKEFFRSLVSENSTTVSAIRLPIGSELGLLGYRLSII
jgi:hypothetical protein